MYRIVRIQTGLQVNGCRGKTERSRARTVKWRARVEIKLSSQSDSGILESPNILRSIKAEAWNTLGLSFTSKYKRGVSEELRALSTERVQ